MLDGNRTPLTEWIDDKELAAWLRISRETAQDWRRLGSGPPFTRIGRAVRYHVPSVREWLAARTVAMGA